MLGVPRPNVKLLLETCHRLQPSKASQRPVAAATRKPAACNSEAGRGYAKNSVTSNVFPEELQNRGTRNKFSPEERRSRPLRSGKNMCLTLETRSFSPPDNFVAGTSNSFYFSGNALEATCCGGPWKLDPSGSRRVLSFYIYKLAQNRPTWSSNWLRT